METPSPILKKDPQVAYNTARREFLVVYEFGEIPQQDLVARRIDAVNGALIGGAISVAALRGNQASLSVAYNSFSDFYLLVYQDFDSNNLPYSLLAAQVLDTFGR